METDSFYSIGYSHSFCEDYTTSGVKGEYSYAIVSDGCSSSPHTDVGARILTNVAKSFLCGRNYNPIMSQLLTSSSEAKGDVVWYGVTHFLKAFLTHLEDTSVKIVRDMGLPLECLDATILFAIGSNEIAHVFLLGDGDLFFKDKNGRSLLIDVDYTSGAPFYPSYLFKNNVQRLHGYYDLFGDNEVVVSDDAGVRKAFTINDVKKLYGDVGEAFSPKSYFCIKQPKLIVLMSDGIKSFTTTSEDGITIPVEYRDIASQFCDFKNYNGEFVQRRIKKIKRQNALAGNIVHHDDISMSAIRFD